MAIYPNRIPDLSHTGAASRVLVVSPDKQTRDDVQAVCEKLGSLVVDYAESGHEALTIINRNLPAAVICDVTLPDFDGFKLCKLLKLPIKSGGETVPVILVSHAYRDVLAEQVARKAKAFAYVKLSVGGDTLKRVIELALYRSLPGPGDACLLGTKGLAQLLVRDEDLAQNLMAALDADGWRTRREAAVPEVLQSWQSLRPPVLFVEIEADPAGLTQMLRSAPPKPIIVALIRTRDPEALTKLMELGVDDFVLLPATPQAFVRACGDARQKHNFRSTHEQFEEQLTRFRSISEYLDLVITNSNEAIFTCDPDGTVRLWNRGAERVYGYSAEEILGKNVDEYLDPPDFKRKSYDVMKLVKQRGSFTDPEVLRRRKSGEIFPVTATYSWLSAADGTAIGFSVMERDVTPIKALENERIKSARLRAITQTAVTANDHINTPLGIILGYAQFLELKLAGIDEHDRGALETIQLQVHKIKNIMNKLRLISDPIVKNYSIEGVTMLDLNRSKSTNEATSL